MRSSRFLADRDCNPKGRRSTIVRKGSAKRDETRKKRRKRVKGGFVGIEWGFDVKPDYPPPEGQRGTLCVYGTMHRF